MSIRELLNRHRNITLGVVMLVVAGAIGMIVMQVLASRRTISAKLPDMYFTVDDGKTFFPASASNIPPFDYNGKQAVSAYVFESNGKKFVAYMERYTPDARKAMLENKASAEVMRFGRELKRPGEATWVKSGDLAVEAKFANVKAPDGGVGTPEAILP